MTPSPSANLPRLTIAPREYVTAKPVMLSDQRRGIDCTSVEVHARFMGGYDGYAWVSHKTHNNREEEANSQADSEAYESCLP